MACGCRRGRSARFRPWHPRHMQSCIATCREIWKRCHLAASQDREGLHCACGLGRLRETGATSRRRPGLPTAITSQMTSRDAPRQVSAPAGLTRRWPFHRAQGEDGTAGPAHALKTPAEVPAVERYGRHRKIECPTEEQCGSLARRRWTPASPDRQRPDDGTDGYSPGNPYRSRRWLGNQKTVWRRILVFARGGAGCRPIRSAKFPPQEVT